MRDKSIVKMDLSSEPEQSSNIKKSANKRAHPNFSRSRRSFGNQPSSGAKTDKPSNNNSNNSSLTVKQARPSSAMPSNILRLMPIAHYRPILVSTRPLGNLIYSIYQRIRATDSAMSLTLFHLYYTMHVVVFAQLLRCDQMLGMVCDDIYLVQQSVENISLPSVLADYVECIGPYRLMSGLNVMPSIGHFMDRSWIKGNIKFCSDYVKTVVNHPRHLFSRFLEEFPDEQPSVEEYLDCERTSVWSIASSVIADYRSFHMRLGRKYECRPISSLLAGKPAIICSVWCESHGIMYRIQCCEEQPVEDVKKAVLFQFNDSVNIEHWPEANRRTLLPSFQSNSYDFSVVLRGYELPEL